MNYGKLLKVLREQSGMTQDELAFRLYVNQSDISKYENNIKELTITIFQSWVMITQASDNSISSISG